MLQNPRMDTLKQAVGISTGDEKDVVGKEHKPGFKKQNQEFIGTVSRCTHAAGCVKVSCSCQE